MDITVAQIRENEREALSNLMKMYCYEWSQFSLFDVDQNGVFPFEQYVHNYFENPHCHCYFVRAGGVLASFALIDDRFVIHKDCDYSMGEFFVMYKYRRMQEGSHLAQTLFDRYRGKWEVGFHPMNIASERFWLRTVAAYTDGQYTLDKGCRDLHYHDGSYGTVLSFDSGIRQTIGR